VHFGGDAQGGGGALERSLASLPIRRAVIAFGSLVAVRAH
jgi:hypothetical protein